MITDRQTLYVKRFRSKTSSNHTNTNLKKSMSHQVRIPDSKSLWKIQAWRIPNTF